MDMKQGKVCLVAILLIGACAIIGIPLLLNLFLGMQNPLGTKIIGNDSDWLCFWGAYLGGILTASIGFATLSQNQKIFSKTITSQNETIIKEHQLAQVKGLERELINRMNSFHMAPIQRIVSRYNDIVSKEVATNMIADLKERLEIAELLAIEWSCMSWHDDLPEKPKDFEAQYIVLLESYRKIILDVIDVLDIYASSGKRPKKNDQLTSLNSRIHQFNNLLTLRWAKIIRTWLDKVTPHNFS